MAKQTADNTLKKSFKVKLTPRGPGGAWTFMIIPFDCAAAFGSKARIPVAGTINGFAFRNSLMPEGDGTHAMMVGKELQAGAKAAPGDTVTVVMSVDREERRVEVPPELQAVLDKNKKAAESFTKLSPSHRKEFAEWVGGAKKEETRLDRAARSVPLIVERKHCR
jgi:Domain of unknown function (DUF1905)/Bacteriocin-protection, YdeI or OmpD-Associated